MRSATLFTIGTLVRPFFASELKWKARACLGLLVILSLGVNGLNVVNSYVGRDFMTAVSEKRAGDWPEVDAVPRRVRRLDGRCGPLPLHRAEAGRGLAALAPPGTSSIDICNTTLTSA